METTTTILPARQDGVKEYFLEHAGLNGPRRELYVQAGYALERAGVDTMIRLCEMEEDEIRQVRGIGAKRLAVVLEERAGYKRAQG